MLLSKTRKFLRQRRRKVLDNIDVGLLLARTQAAYLDHADRRRDATDNLEYIGRLGDVHTDAEVGFLPLHRLQEALGRGVGVRCNAGGVCPACGRHFWVVVLCEMHIIMFSSQIDKNATIRRGPWES